MRREALRKNSRLVNGDLLLRLSTAATEVLNCLDDIETIGNLAKDDMLAIEPRCNDGGDKELGSVAIEKWCVNRYSVEGGERKGVQSTYVLGPALAMESRPGLVCLSAKFSSENFSP